MAFHPDVYVEQNEDDSWIRLGGNASDVKLKNSTSDEFKYVTKPSGIASQSDMRAAGIFQGWEQASLITL
jgi:hypothetical protein